MLRSVIEEESISLKKPRTTSPHQAASTMLRDFSRESGNCPVPIDWKFKTSPRWLRRHMIEEAYAEIERQKALQEASMEEGYKKVAATDGKPSSKKELQRTRRKD